MSARKNGHPEMRGGKPEIGLTGFCIEKLAEKSSSSQNKIQGFEQNKEGRRGHTRLKVRPGRTDAVAAEILKFSQERDFSDSFLCGNARKVFTTLRFPTNQYIIISERKRVHKFTYIRPFAQ
jgi:hypothetical protein